MKAIEGLVEEAVRLLHEEDEAINEKIERAFGEFERGEFFTLEQTRATLGEHRAAWIVEKNGE